MLYHAENGALPVGESVMDYIRFGSGEQTLVMLPGAGDGLKTVRGAALPFALLYRDFARRCTVYVFSRRRDLPDGFTTRDMAADTARAMDALGLKKACVLGVSQGGMIAQHLAVDRPDLVGKLILAVTLARQNDVCRAVLTHWIDLARRGDSRALLLDTAERSYSARYLRRMRPVYALAARFGKPQSFDRFFATVNACLTHDAYDALPGIACPTLVIGGADDRIVTAQGSEDCAAQIPDSRLILYPGLGHAAYDETGDFWKRVLAFL